MFYKYIKWIWQFVNFEIIATNKTIRNKKFGLESQQTIDNEKWKLLFANNINKAENFESKRKAKYYLEYRDTHNLRKS